MARSKVRLDHRGLARVLTSTGVHQATQAAAEEVADRIRNRNITVGDVDGGKHEEDLPVEVTMTTTDRAHANLTLAHPAGAAVQAKHGALTRAAGEAGLDVNGRR